MISAFGFFSEYYLNNSVFRLEDILKHAKKENYPFVAISDGNYLYSSYKLVSNNLIPYLQGLLIKVNNQEKEDELLVYALNKEGYNSLIILSSYTTLVNEVIPIDILKQYQENLLVITAGYKSSLYSYLRNNYLVESVELLNTYKSSFKHFYIGLSLQSFDDEIIVAPKIKELALKQSVKLLPVNFMAYLKEDKEVYQVLSQMHDLVFNYDLSFLTLKELENRYLDYPEVFINLKEVSKLFNYKYEKEKYKFPSNFKNSKQTLKELSKAGLIKKGLNDPLYFKRLNDELEVITELNYQDYFLIVSDFVSYAKNKGILVGPGRGSAAGSLVSYALNITNVDPLKYGLIFERFLNKARKTMPDIDLDFPDDKRDEVILYVAEKYGKNHVVSINTFARYSEKSSIRDILRIKGYRPFEVNQIINQLKTNQKLDEKLEEVKYISSRLDGIPRQTGTHAAGIILAKEDLRYKIPLQRGPLIVQTQYEFQDLENIGLLKMDFLGIKNLAIISETLELLEKNENIKIDLDKIPLDDFNTYELLKSGDTTGIFQLESQGMRSTLRKLLPTNFNDITAILALYRPGPMQNIDTYIKRRNGASFTYLDDELKNILKETYGIIVYQEQIMEIARVFAGYSLEEADLLRVGISKKDLLVLEKEKDKFIKRSVLNGKNETKAKEMYDYILRFADYGFNKSHSVSYALVAYQMAYLKTNYYGTFMQVLLSNMAIGDSQTKFIIESMHQRGIKVIAPSINRSTKRFEKFGNTLIYPLTGIKGIGSALANAIILERENGIFKDYPDFKKRLLKTLNNKAIEALIFSGALDEFGLNKRTLYETITEQYDLYESIGLDIKKTSYDEYDLDYLVSKEVEVLDIQLSSKTYEKYQELYERHNLLKLSDVNFKLKSARTLATLETFREITTKTDALMAFARFKDGAVSIEATIFSDLYLEIKDNLNKNGVYILLLEKSSYKGDNWVLKNIKKIK